MRILIPQCTNSLILYPLSRHFLLVIELGLTCYSIRISYGITRIVIVISISLETFLQTISQHYALLCLGSIIQKPTISYQLIHYYYYCYLCFLWRIQGTRIIFHWTFLGILLIYQRTRISRRMSLSSHLPRTILGSYQRILQSDINILSP